MGSPDLELASEADAHGLLAVFARYDVVAAEGMSGREGLDEGEGGGGGGMDFDRGGAGGGEDLGGGCGEGEDVGWVDWKE